MIRISNASVEPSSLIEQWKLKPLAKKILGKMSASRLTYDYDDAEQLHFELILRSNIVQASYDLNRTGAQFATFAKSRCNPRYWELTDKGGFLLKNGVTPARGIQDLFQNGHLYAFECATAMVIVLYKALLDTIPDEVFNSLFANLLLWDGHYDQDLQLESIREVDSLPGDILYFKNPDVNPHEQEWQGENAVDLGDGTFYGHGIGIATPARIIYFLNRHRITGSETSAYLTDRLLRPDFRRLATLDGSIPAMALREESIRSNRNDLVVVKIGNTVHISV